jgi:tRNA (guanine-N7-)-methyltransferase
MLVNEAVLDKLWSIVEKPPFESEFVLEVNRNKKFNLDIIFKSNFKKFFLELGSGWGEVSIELAKKNPDTAFLLMEKNRGRLLVTEREIKKYNLQNIRLICCNFNWFLKELFFENSFDEILLNFPDPWEKKKHWQNRTMNLDFLGVVDSILKPKGRFRFATDHGGYARKSIQVLRKVDFFHFTKEFSFERDKEFPYSKFELEKLSEKKCIYYIERLK